MRREAARLGCGAGCLWEARDTGFSFEGRWNDQIRNTATQHCRSHSRHLFSFSPVLQAWILSIAETLQIRKESVGWGRCLLLWPGYVHISVRNSRMLIVFGGRLSRRQLGFSEVMSVRSSWWHWWFFLAVSYFCHVTTHWADPCQRLTRCALLLDSPVFRTSGPNELLLLRVSQPLVVC